MKKRVFVIVLDSFGVGAEPDAADFGDVGANTLAAVSACANCVVPNMTKLGLYNLDGVTCRPACEAPVGVYGRMQERSRGKDTTVGHWELAGLAMNRALPTFPNGFPADFIAAFEKATGRKTLCNKPYSGTKLLQDYGEEHLATGALLVYTSADSVFQVAAHEDIVPVQELYRYCEIARGLLQGERLGVGRVIARPFIGTCAADFKRTANRHDFSLTPPAPTLLNVLQDARLDTIAVGKINDIFNGSGVSQSIHTAGNTDGLAKTTALQQQDFHGLCFVNLVDFDMLYGHRRDPAGYAAALAEFDRWLSGFMPAMAADDLLLITADHGCDPTFTKTTDHTREYAPLLAYTPAMHRGANFGTQDGYGTVAATVCDALGVAHSFPNNSIAVQIADAEAQA